jgi:hypothetical protein
MEPWVIAFIIVGALFLLLWIPLLIFGISRWRRGNLPLGVFCTVCGGAWGLCAVGGVGLVLIGFLAARQMEKANNFTPFDPTTYAGAQGTLVLDWPDKANLLMVSADGQQRYTIDGDGGRLTLPAGEFTLSTLSLVKADPDGREWTAYLIPPREHPTLTLSVPADGETTLAVSPPFQAQAKVKALSNGNHRFDLQVTHAAGFTVRLYGNDRKPALKVLDAAGTVLLQQNFEYG